MKHNKTLGILSVALVLGLVGCTGNKDTSKQTSAKTSKTSKPSVSTLPPEPVKEVMAEEAILVKGTDNKVYFQVSGTYDLYNAGELKLAWAVVGASTGNYYSGKETPEAADYTANGVTLDATAKTFVAKYCLTDVANLSAAELYNVYVGTAEDTGMMYDMMPVTDASFSDSDANYSYFIRDDQSNAIAVEKAGAISYTTARIEALTGDHEGTWLRLYAAKGSWTLETLAELNLVCDFQQMAQYSKPMLTEEQKFFDIVDNQVVLSMKCDQLAAGDSYMTHVGYEGETNPGKLVLTESIDNVEYTIGSRKYTIHFDKTKGQNDGPSEFYGALGLYVEEVEAE